jgi:hypothetical protein
MKRGASTATNSKGKQARALWPLQTLNPSSSPTSIKAFAPKILAKSSDV